MPPIDLRFADPQQTRRDTPSAADIRLMWLGWRPDSPHEQARVLTVAELSECRCPDLCDRDHPNE
jgi:hypothetical protein